MRGSSSSSSSSGLIPIVAWCFIILLALALPTSSSKNNNNCMKTKQTNSHQKLKEAPIIISSDGLPEDFNEFEEDDDGDDEGESVPRGLCNSKLSVECSAVITKCTTTYCNATLSPSCLNCIGAAGQHCCPCLKKVYNKFPC